MAYFNILIPILSLCFNILTQIFSYKYILRKELLKSEYLGCLCGFILLIVCELAIREDLFKEWLFLVFANLIIYACFSYCYFTFINMGETARRIRLLRELYDAPFGLTGEEILKRYNAEEVINIRMNRLLNNGQIVLRNGRYYIGSPIMLLISRMIVFMKIIVLGRESEFRK